MDKTFSSKMRRSYGGHQQCLHGQLDEKDKYTCVYIFVCECMCVYTERERDRRRERERERVKNQDEIDSNR